MVLLQVEASDAFSKVAPGILRAQFDGFDAIVFGLLEEIKLEQCMGSVGVELCPVTLNLDSLGVELRKR